MKKITLLTFVIIAFGSCKKNYDCECVKSGTVTYNTTVSAKSSSDAKTQCSAYDSNSFGSCSIK